MREPDRALVAAAVLWQSQGALCACACACSRHGVSLDPMMLPRRGGRAACRRRSSAAYRCWCLPTSRTCRMRAARRWFRSTWACASWPAARCTCRAAWWVRRAARMHACTHVAAPPCTPQRCAGVQGGGGILRRVHCLSPPTVLLLLRAQHVRFHHSPVQACRAAGRACVASALRRVRTHAPMHARLPSVPRRPRRATA